MSYAKSLAFVSITLPTNASNGGKLSTLIAAGTVVTATADLPPELAGLSATVDNVTVTGSSPLTRAIAQRAVQVAVNNHTATFSADGSSAMTAPESIFSGTRFQTEPAAEAITSTYLRNGAASTAAVTAKCALVFDAVNALTRI